MHIFLNFKRKNSWIAKLIHVFLILQEHVPAKAVIKGSVAYMKKKQIDVVELTMRLYELNIISTQQKDKVVNSPYEVKVDDFMELLLSCDENIFERVKIILKHFYPVIWKEMVLFYRPNNSNNPNPEDVLPKKKRKGRLTKCSPEKQPVASTSVNPSLGFENSLGFGTEKETETETQSQSILPGVERPITNSSTPTIVQLLNSPVQSQQSEIGSISAVSEAVQPPPSTLLQVTPASDPTPNPVIPLHIIRSAIMLPPTAANMMCKMKLGMGCFVTAGVWPLRHELRINIRQFDACGRVPLPKKGVSLTLSRWIIFRNLKERIDDVLNVNRRVAILRAKEEISQVNPFIPQALFEHLGGNMFVQIHTGGTFIDIRKWWYPNTLSGLTPTRTGIILNYDQWMNLKHCFTLMPEVVPELETTVPCYQTHESCDLYISCKECNPPWCWEN